MCIRDSSTSATEDEFSLESLSTLPEHNQGNETTMTDPQNATSRVAKCVLGIYAECASPDDFCNSIVALVERMEQSLVEKDAMIDKIRTENEKTVNKVHDEWEVYIAQFKEEYRTVLENLHAEVTDKTENLSYFMDQNTILNLSLIHI